MGDSFGLIFASGIIDDYDAHYTMLADLPPPDSVICADDGLSHAWRMGVIPSLILGDFDSADTVLLKTYQEMGIPSERQPIEKNFTDAELAVERLARDGCGSILILGALGARIDHSFTNLQLLYKYALRGIRVVLANEYGAAAAFTTAPCEAPPQNSKPPQNLPQPIISPQLQNLPQSAVSLPPISHSSLTIRINKQRPLASLLGRLDFDAADPLAGAPAGPAKPLRNPLKLSILPVGGAARGVTTTGLKYPLCRADLDAFYTSGISNEFIGDEATIEIAGGALYVMLCAD